MVRCEGEDINTALMILWLRYHKGLGREERKGRMQESQYITAFVSLCMCTMLLFYTYKILVVNKTLRALAGFQFPGTSPKHIV